MVALRELEVGPAYAVWTGIGAAGTATAGSGGTEGLGEIAYLKHPGVLVRLLYRKRAPSEALAAAMLSWDVSRGYLVAGTYGPPRPISCQLG